MTAKRRTTLLLVTSVLVAGGLLSACSHADRDTAGSTSAPDKAVAPMAGGAEPEAAQRQQADADKPAQALDLSVGQRSIVYRGDISVRVDDVTRRAAEVTGIVTTAGGFVGGDNRTRGDGDDVATMQLRVPADKFATVVDQLSHLGNEESRRISTEDVTEETVDLDARITVQQARVDSGRRLLSRAKSLSDLVMLEREVATREADLASLQAKKRRLADLVTLSTITATLLGPHAPVSGPADRPAGFLGGLAAGWHALLAALAVLSTVLGAVLPWLLGVGLPLWGVYLLVRRAIRSRRKPRPKPADGPDAGSA